MKITEEMIQEMKDLYKNKSGEEIDDEKAYEAASNLLNFAELIFDISMKEVQKKARLRKEPDGFPVDGNYTCLICHGSINETNGWWDILGPKCLLCQKAISEGTIPRFVCINRDSWFPMWKLNSTFEIKTPTAKKYMREGILKAREVLNESGKVHVYVFLKKDNPELIERYNPVRKSYDRHRDKVTEQMLREEKKKLNNKKSTNTVKGN